MFNICVDYHDAKVGDLRNCGLTPMDVDAVGVENVWDASPPIDAHADPNDVTRVDMTVSSHFRAFRWQSSSFDIATAN